MFRTVVAILFLAAVGVAQDETPAKPLKAGDKVPDSYRAFLAVDQRFEKDSPRNRPKKMHDLVTDNGLNPVLVAFTRQTPAADTATAKLAARMSALVTTFKPERLGGFVVFLTLDKEYPEEEKRDAKAEAAENLSKQLQSGNVPFALSPRKSAASAAWGLSEKDEIVVMYYNRHTVQKVWAFAADKPPTEDDLKAISAYVEGDLKPKR